VKEKLKVRFSEFIQFFKGWIKKDKRRGAIVVGSVGLFLVYGISCQEEKTHYIYEGGNDKFSQAHVVENPYKHLAENKIEIVEETQEGLRRDNRELQRQMTEVKKILEGMATREPQQVKPAPQPVVNVEQIPAPQPQVAPAPPVEFGASGLSGPVQFEREIPSRIGGSFHGASKKAGPYSITFPVAVSREDKPTGIVIPSGSYVKTKIVGGVQVPMGETYPALLQVDFAFVKPNNRRIDLSGCFIVAKAEGDISTERLQMSPHSISCYNKSGMYFKRDKLVGWAADTKDNDFALRAEVNLNQGRVAQSAFAKALIDGLGQSLERNTKSVGGKGIDDQSPSVVLKESGQQVGSMVADFYLSYLKGLRPTMKVTSGRDAWLVLGSDIELPYAFFKKEESDEGTSESSNDLFR
jgi:hypothetical protein